MSYGIPGYYDPTDDSSPPNLSVKTDWNLTFKETGMFLGMFALGYLTILGAIDFAHKIAHIF